MKSEDLDGFVEIVESEALSLHAMMMTQIHILFCLSEYFINN